MGGKEKKRSKKGSSQVRKKMRHRSRCRKRSSKKMRRPEDSYSESDDESQSLASSSSEEDGKRRRSRSRARMDGKARKRRARSSSSGSDGSIDSRRAKKRKRLKRKVEGGRKKAGRKSRRELSVSSGSDESDYEKPRGSSKKKELSRRYGKKDSMKERKWYRSPSVSSSSGVSEKERRRKRYRSPSRSSLSVSSETGNRTKRKRYWSPSGSSLSGLSGSRDQHIENEIVEVQNKPARKLSSIIVLPKETDLLTMSGEHEKDYARRDEYGERSSKSNLVETDDQINESKTEDTVSLRDNQDLESILRRKALENLKKFRGPEKAEKSDKAEMRVEVVKQLPEPENVTDLESIGRRRMKHSYSSDKDPGLIIDDSSKDVDQISTLKKEEVSTTPYGSTENVGEPFQLSKDNKVLLKAAAQMVDDSSLDPPADKKSNIRDDRRIAVSQPGQSDPLLASQEPPAACSTKEPKLSPPEPLGATPDLDRCSSDKSGSIATDKVKPNNIKEANTAATSASDNPSSPTTMAVEQHAEQKESSQFQEKTMSVMRGGELVQVSYKVYIPKKVPAVARRRLKR